MTKVNKELCIGCGACVSVCSDGFEIDDGKAKIKNLKTKCIKEVINICPVSAIK